MPQEFPACAAVLSALHLCTTTRQRAQPGAGGGRAAVAIVHPSDEGEPFCSTWACDHVRSLEEESGLHRVCLDMCRYGVGARHPLTISSNLNSAGKNATTAPAFLSGTDCDKGSFTGGDVESFQRIIQTFEIKIHIELSLEISIISNFPYH